MRGRCLPTDRNLYNPPPQGPRANTLGRAADGLKTQGHYHLPLAFGFGDAGARLAGAPNPDAGAGLAGAPNPGEDFVLRWLELGALLPLSPLGPARDEFDKRDPQLLFTQSGTHVCTELHEKPSQHGFKSQNEVEQPPPPPPV